jgi:hypothetical protein
VLRPRDRCRTITPLLLLGVLPEPVHAARSDAEISTITQLARVPGKELPQEALSNPVPVCPPPAVADPHDAHPHPGFTRRQHSAHVKNPPVVQNVTQLSGVPFRSTSRTSSYYDICLSTCGCARPCPGDCKLASTARKPPASRGRADRSLPSS